MDEALLDAGYDGMEGEDATLEVVVHELLPFTDGSLETFGKGVTGLAWADVGVGLEGFALFIQALDEDEAEPEATVADAAAAEKAL